LLSFVLGLNVLLFAVEELVAPCGFHRPGKKSERGEAWKTKQDL
jgi:hypothetical protein